MMQTIPDFWIGDKEYKNIKADYHRNGVSGRGFLAITLTEVKIEEVGRGFAPVAHNFLITWFMPYVDDDGNEEREDPAIAVYDRNMLRDDEKAIQFGYNSWRGDHYLAPARRIYTDFRHLTDIDLYEKCLNEECESRFHEEKVEA